MQLGMIGLGRMGANMVRRLLRAGHDCVVFDVNPEAVDKLAAEGAVGTKTLEAFAAALRPPRAAWLMVPAALVDTMIEQVRPHFSAGDILIDGGNSHYIDDIRRAGDLAADGLHFLDIGTSGGVWGLERGYCLMIGGETAIVQHLNPIFAALAPGQGATPPATGREGRASTAEQGYLHCGPSGAGHFVKMVHNGIEYGLMAAYAEGFNILRRADVGLRPKEKDAETTPLRHPEHYQYTFDLPDIAELWRRGSVVASWLLDLAAGALAKKPDLDGFRGEVSDSGEGRWTIATAIEEGTSAPVLSAALYQRFTSRGDDEFACKLLSALRFEFGGHIEKK